MRGIHSETHDGKFTMRIDEDKNEVYVDISSRQPPYMGDENCFEGVSSTFPLKSYLSAVEQLKGDNGNGECMISNGKYVLALQASKGKLALARIDELNSCRYSTYNMDYAQRPIELSEL